MLFRSRNPDNSWHVTISDVKTGDTHAVDAKYVFIGAGGGALDLLQKTGIPEEDNYARFPVGGSFLVTENPAITQQHLEKVYGQASVGAPPMSVPHLDARFLDGKRVVLFGPFATFSTKFLKNGSLFDLLSTTTSPTKPVKVAFGRLIGLNGDKSNEALAGMVLSMAMR